MQVSGFNEVIIQLFDFDVVVHVFNSLIVLKILQVSIGQLQNAIVKIVFIAVKNLLVEVDMVVHLGFLAIFVLDLL